MQKYRNLLDVINDCDDFPRPEDNMASYTAAINSYYHFKVASFPNTLGYVLPAVALKFANFSGSWEINENAIPKTLTLIGGHDEESRTAIVSKTINEMHVVKAFEILKKLRNELKPIYGPGGELLFSIERAAFPLLGIVAYGVHMVAYTRDDDINVDSLWVSQRGREASGYANYLDNTVAGGIKSGESPLEALVREAGEEARLPADVVREHAKSCGTLSYFHVRKSSQGGEPGLLHPGVQFLYEMAVQEDWVPEPNDKEIAHFKQLRVDEVTRAILDDKVKPFTALVLIDFLVRHGIVNEANTAEFVEISMRLHRSLEFPTSKGFSK
ncbi:thiamine pyrophosphokinase-related protein [Poronia punctata]|nr:thiamine pyrophosphokinase-related protein [Poronia punctata]